MSPTRVLKCSCTVQNHPPLLSVKKSAPRIARRGRRLDNGARSSSCLVLLDQMREPRGESAREIQAGEGKKKKKRSRTGGLRSRASVKRTCKSQAFKENDVCLTSRRDIHEIREEKKQRDLPSSLSPLSPRSASLALWVLRRPLG